MKSDSQKISEQEKLIEGIDYYFEKNLMVLTEHFLLKRGYCCGNGCRHCPFSGEKKNHKRKVSSSS